MLTPQEVSSHAFSKAVMGGYNMAMVDEFLDELTDDYTALYKENAALKAKLKVLVEKVEDYRATEDSMRATLLTAQKMADSIVREAEAKREDLLAQAEGEARSRIGKLQDEVTASEQRLKAGRRELADFIARSREICEKEISYLEELPKLPIEETPVPAQESEQTKAEETVDEVQQTIFAAFAPAEEETPEPEPPEEKTEKEPEKPAYPAGNPFAGKDDPAPQINLRDLKFGRNYASGDREF